ncbi:hypothetical protein EXS62_01255 [Candidatus Kaiserbacteria bacterium]|nr:hypothetical protein [Candidatus Kaiserbacteria bacterium]
MENLVIELTTNPLRYIEYFLATLGAVGALLFLAGIGGGLPHLFTYSHGADHMSHARTRAIWGIYLCMVTLGLWEVIRVIIGAAPASYLILSLVLFTPAWIPWLYKLATGKGGNGH